MKPVERLHAHLPFVQILASAPNPRTLEYFLTQLNDNQLLLLQDIVRNFLHGNISVSSGEIKSLKRYKNLLRRLISPKVSRNSQRKLIKQVGSGVFSILLPALASLLLSRL